MLTGLGWASCQSISYWRCVRPNKYATNWKIVSVWYMTIHHLELISGLSVWCLVVGQVSGFSSEKGYNCLSIYVCYSASDRIYLFSCFRETVVAWKCLFIYQLKRSHWKLKNCVMTLWLVSFEHTTCYLHTLLRNHNSRIMLLDVMLQAGAHWNGMTTCEKLQFSNSWNCRILLSVVM